jgi:hypothetical protein
MLYHLVPFFMFVHHCSSITVFFHSSIVFSWFVWVRHRSISNTARCNQRDWLCLIDLKCLLFKTLILCLLITSLAISRCYSSAVCWVRQRRISYLMVFTDVLFCCSNWVNLLCFKPLQCGLFSSLIYNNWLHVLCCFHPSFVFCLMSWSQDNKLTTMLTFVEIVVIEKLTFF